MKAAIITGSADGIGATTAKLLSKNGFSVMVADINEAKAEKVADEINTNGGKALSFKVNVADRKEVSMMVENTFTAFERIDVLINNAGINYFTPIEEVSDHEWDAVLEVNVKGVYNCSKYVIPHMKQRKSGRIVNISSSAGKMGGPVASIHYAASKAAVICMTKSFARHLAPFNITVNSVCPGGVEGGMLLKIPEQARNMAIQAIPLQRFATPKEIAESIAFLVSNEASYITGEILDVNGGTVMD